MLRTIWFALTCLAALGAVIAIKTAPAPVAVAVPHDQAATGLGFEPNRAAKSDRLPIPDSRELTETDLAPSVAMATPVEAPSTGPGTTETTIDETTRKTTDATPKKAERRRWQDSNAALIADSPPRRRAAARPGRTNAHTDDGKTTGNVFRCRQDAVGGLLTSLGLSPRCSS
jgi:hypothetical protein